MLRVHSEAVSCLLQLPLSAVSSSSNPRDRVAAMRERQQALREKKRRAKESVRKRRAGGGAGGGGGVALDAAALRRDLAEGEAQVDARQRLRFERAALTAVFDSLFSLLKRGEEDAGEAGSGHCERLLPLVLQGLEKFASLVNVELLTELLQRLQAVISPSRASDAQAPPLLQRSAALASPVSRPPLCASRPLPVSCTLSAVSAVLRLSGEGEGAALRVELRECQSHLYAALWSCMQPEHQRCVPAALSCVEQLLLRQTGRAEGGSGASAARVAAFQHRCLLLAASLTSAPLALLVLRTVHRLLSSFPPTRALLSDSAACSTGRFLPLLDDADACNAQAEPLHALTALLWSSEPAVVQAARAIVLQHSNAEDDGSAAAAALWPTHAAELLAEADLLPGFFPPPVAAGASGRAARARHPVAAGTDFLPALQQEQERRQAIRQQ